MKVKLDEYAFPPERAHRQDAGLDIRTPIDFCVRRGDSKIISTGVHVQIPYGYVGFLKSKSGLNVKFGITSEGVIDSGYTGEIVCKLYNNDPNRDAYFQRGDKITQLVILPCYLDDIEIVDEIHGGDRGDNGFGSTGR